MDLNSLNSLMSAAELGVVIGVVLEGIEHIPSIKARWPILEKIGFAILVLSLIGDWHFQSEINERHTNDLISAHNRIAELVKAVSPRSLSDAEQKDIADACRPCAD